MELIKLKPATKDYIWGGTKLKQWGKDAPYDNIAECWELSFHKDGPCLIDSGIDKGKYLLDVASKADLGELVNSFPFFPVLIKLIDSSSNLSVQVHPSDAYALEHENSYGKTEMWYVIASEPGSGLYIGLKEDSTREEIEKSLLDSTILDKLNFFPVKEGESYFIPSGTIHAIGKGVTVIEIQQNSNLTYRLYDYKRKDKNGKERELHIEKALKVIDYKKYQRPIFPKNVIGSCKYFTSRLEICESEMRVKASEKSFISVTFIKGKGKINDLDFKELDTFFLPADKEMIIQGKSEFVMTDVE